MSTSTEHDKRERTSRETFEITRVELQDLTDHESSLEISTQEPDNEVTEQCTTVDENDYMKGYQLYLCLLSLALSLFLAAFDINIVSVLVEPISIKFNAYSLSGWMTSGYSFSQAVCCLFWGKISIIFGFKSCMLASIAVFEVGALVSALATSMNMLIGGRVISGIGGSGIQTLVMVIISFILSEKNRVAGIAAMSSAFAVASVLGPFLGGAFATHTTWRWCFFINLPIGAVASVVFMMSFNQYGNSNIQDFKHFIQTVRNYRISKIKAIRSHKREILLSIFFEFDVICVILFSAAFTLVLLATSLGGNKYKWNSGTIIALFVVGSITLLLSMVYDWFIFDTFVRKYSSTSVKKYRPLIPLDIVTNSAILLPSFATLFICIIFNGALLYIVQYFQLVWNISPWYAGIHLVPALVATVLTLSISTRITRKTGNVKFCIVFGGAAAVAGSGLLLLLDQDSSNSEKIGTLILIGVAFGSVVQSCLLSAQVQLVKSSPTYNEDFIMVTTFNTFTKAIGLTLGSILATTTFTSSVSNHLNEIAIDGFSPRSTNDLIVYWTVNYGGRNSAIAKIFVNAIHNVFYLCIGVGGVGFVCCIFSSSKKVMTGRKKPQE